MVETVKRIARRRRAISDRIKGLEDEGKAVGLRGSSLSAVLQGCSRKGVSPTEGAIVAKERREKELARLRVELAGLDEQMESIRETLWDICLKRLYGFPACMTVFLLRHSDGLSWAMISKRTGHSRKACQKYCREMEEAVDQEKAAGGARLP
jgi:hypothetical protein